MRLTGAKMRVFCRTIFNTCGRWFHEIKIRRNPDTAAYRVSDFCKSVGLGKTKFYELLQAGKIKTITIGGRRLVPADEAQRIVREGVQ
jgi:excisionase family DNA binding protein